MKLLVGLGNPGEKYENTRHNAGFVVLDTLLKKYEDLDKTFWETDKKNHALTKKITIAGESVLLVKPMTFMNDSGRAVLAVSSYYKILSEDIIVIHDDIDLPLGKERIRFGGGAGGHHGVESIIEHLKTDKFLRVRLGIGTSERQEDKSNKKRAFIEDYVLSVFPAQEKGKLKTMVNQTLKNIVLLVEHGIETYMSKYNGVDKKVVDIA